MKNFKFFTSDEIIGQKNYIQQKDLQVSAATSSNTTDSTKRLCHNNKTNNICQNVKSVFAEDVSNWNTFFYC